MKNTVFTLLLTVLTLSVSAQRVKRFEKRLTNNVESHIAYLASDDLEGRGNGTDGEQLSAKYIANQFEEIGLSSKGSDGYFQHFKITTLRIAQASTSLLINDKAYTLFMEFYPLSISANKGSFTGDLVNVSYGIEDQMLRMNNYENVDVNNKAVLIKLETPDADNPHGHYSAWSGISRRVELAISKGAKAVILYGKDPHNKPDGTLGLRTKTASIPVFYVYDDLDSTLSTSVDLTSDIMALNEQVSNVLGFIDHGAANTVVIGAHHDHLGHGEMGGSRAEAPGGIHNGADDNASGVAAMIELAKIIKKHPKKFANNNYLFIAFTAEELGLMGSKYFVEHPTVPLTSINYMINMDMVGKLDSTKKVLVVNGVGTSPAWGQALEQVNMDERKIASVKTTESGIGASDHTSFYLAGIPAVHFFTGQHEHYHKPSDDLGIVNSLGEAYVITYICKWLEVMDKQGKVAYVKTKEETQEKMSFKVTLGIMPDYIYDGEGLRVDGVKDGRPGADAGLMKGDVIVSINGVAIMNIQDYMKVLSSLKKGDTVPIKFKRGDEYLESTVSF